MTNEHDVTYDELKARLADAEAALQGIRQEQAESEDRESHIKQVLLAIRNVNQLIVRETDPEQLMQKACANLTETLGYHNAWIALLDEKRKVIMTASSGFDGGFRMMQEKLNRDDFPACMRQALAQEHAVVVKDPVISCVDCPLSREYGGRAGMTHRLYHEGKLYGILSVSVPAAYAFDPEEQELFDELADDMGFALHKIAAEEQVHRLSHIVRTLPHPMSFISRDYRYLAVSDVYAAIYNVPREHIVGRTAADFFGEAVFEKKIRPHLDLCLAGETVRYQDQFEFPDNHLRWMAMEYHPYRDERGDIVGVISYGIDISDQRQAQEELRRSEDLFRKFFDTNLNYCYMISPEGIILDVNTAALKAMGYERDELVGQPLAMIYAPESQARRMELFEKWKQTGHISNEEMTLQTQSGQRRIVLLNAGHVFDSEGRPIHSVSIQTDITDRKEAEKRLEQTLYATTGGIWYWHFPTNTLTFSPRYYTMLKYEPDEFLSTFENWLDLIHPEDRASALSVAEEYLQIKPDHYENEFRMRTKNGEYRWIQTRARVVERSPEGQAVLMIGNHEDITERKLADERFRRGQAMLARTERIAHVGSWEWEIASDTVRWSEELYRIFGMEPGEKPPSWAEHNSLYYPEDFVRLKEVVEKVISDGTPYEVELRAVRKDGEGCICLVRGFAEMGPEGRAFRLFGSVQDITDQKHAQQEKERMEDQFRQAQKLESIGRLAGGVAHDFNNMLGVVIANAESAEMDIRPDQPGYKNIQEILNASHRAADTVRQLLAFARKQIISPKILDLDDTVSGALKMLSRLIGEDIALRWIPSKGVGKVRMDPNQVHQILANLVVNSRDAMPEGGTITIETANKVVDESYAGRHNGFVPGDYVVLTVSDTGEGMSQEVLEQVFDPFFTTKEVGKGTGLGLPMIYGSVKQSDGFIYLYSEPGEGTTVKIYLPRCQDERPKTEDPVGQNAPGGSETILLAEDEEPFLLACKEALERQGYTVLAASSPDRALALAEQYEGEIHMLLSDVVMPHMNGRELLDCLREKRPAIKFLFMSGYTADVMARHGVLDAGVQFIEKPFSFKGLAEKVREVLDT